MELHIHPGLNGGDRKARRKKQRANRGRSKDNRVISCALARALSPLQGGSASRTTEMPSKLQLLQQFAVAGSEEGKQIWSKKDHAIYVGISNPTSRLAEDGEKDGVKKEEKENKKGEPSAAGTEQLNKFPRSVKDGLLLVVTARINGHSVRALIDSGATRCFVTPAYVTAVGLKGQPQDTFLELGNGQKYLSRGFVPDVPVVTTGLTVSIGLTVTSLLHEVDLVLGINWLQLVSPVIDWSSGKIYLPNSVHTALLQGDWLAGHVKSGTVTVLAGEEQLKSMNDAETQKKISILKCPRFWRSTKKMRTIKIRGRILLKGVYNGDTCTIMTVNCVN